MLKNYLTIAWRSFKKHKLYAFINLFGLAIGLAFCLMIYLFVQHELSFDRFHANAEHIYRLHVVEYLSSGAEDNPSWLGLRKNDQVSKHPYLPLPMGPELKANLPEIHQYCRFSEDGGIVKYENRVFDESLQFVDGNFFELFSFRLLSGTPATVLDREDKVVITESVAKKYFGSQDPIGKALEIDSYGENASYTVAGIAEDPPSNSSVTYNILLRMETQPYYERNLERWGNFNTPLFVELAENADLAGFDEKLQAFKEDKLKGSIEWAMGARQLNENDNVMDLAFVPMPEIHLDNEVFWSGTGSRLNIVILSAIALLILIIACLNYISLALTSASGRMLEVGIRKVLGSTRSQLARLFWMEAQLLVVLALGIAIVLLEVFLPVFNGFVQRDLDFSWTAHGGMFLTMLLVVVVTGFIAGGYPALFISRFKPVHILKGNKTYRYKPGLTRLIVVTQYALSAFLIISALIMYRQMRFVNEKDLGFDQEQIIQMSTYTGWNDEGEELMVKMREELKYNDKVLAVTGMSEGLTRGYDIRGFDVDGKHHRAFVYRVDHDYLKTMGMTMVEGRDFNSSIQTDKTQAVIINEAMAQDLQLDSPIGEIIPWTESGTSKEVIGVVKNFHFLSLNQSIEPLMFHLNPDQGKIMTLVLKLSGGDVPGTIRDIQSTWKEVAGDKPFDYTFLDEAVANQYESYQRWMRIMGVATLFAIFIACLGLFGLAGIMAVNKTKEIGIRKVLGAGAYNIWALLNRDLVKLAVIAVLLAAPVSWYVMNKWLGNFEYKISIGWESFAVAGVLCLLIALLTVSYHSLRAAFANPVESLRYE